MINQETVQAILDTVRVDEVVGDFVQLKKRGTNYLGLCPFHNEKTPSFMVSPSKGIYKCFGCGKGGSAVNFVMEHEHYTYPEALRYLAEKYNIEIEEEERTPEQLQALDERESLFHVSAFAQKFFSETLFETEQGKAIGLSYFKERDFLEETIKKFQLGYSPDQWDALTKEALKNGYKLEFLEKSGLTVNKPPRQYDRFRQRVIFPIHSLAGRVIGFGARILSKDKNKPKYLNSPESVIYNKSRVLYGIYFAKSAIAKLDNCLLVEGYTDVISLHQAGIENVVASSGTSLTTDQIKLISRYTNNITILYDGDAAGIKASFRGIDMILEQGMNVRIVLFPDGEDPDSFARSHRRNEVEEYIGSKASDFILFKTNLLLKDAANDPIKRAGLIKEIVSSISLIPDGITRSVYVKECSTVLEVPEQTLLNELNSLLRKHLAKKAGVKPRDLPPDPIPTEQPAKQQPQLKLTDSYHQEREIIRLLLLYGVNKIEFEEENELGKKVAVPVTVAEFIVPEVAADEITFDKAEFQAIFDEYLKALEAENIPEESHFLNHNDITIQKTAIDLVSTPHELSGNWERNRIFVNTEESHLRMAVENSVFAFKARKVDQMIASLQDELKTANEEDMLILLTQIDKLKRAGMEINKQLSRIIIR